MEIILVFKQTTGIMSQITELLQLARGQIFAHVLPYLFWALSLSTWWI